MQLLGLTVLLAIAACGTVHVDGDGDGDGAGGAGAADGASGADARETADAGVVAGGCPIPGADRCEDFETRAWSAAWHASGSSVSIVDDAARSGTYALRAHTLAALPGDLTAEPWGFLVSACTDQRTAIETSLMVRAGSEIAGMTAIVSDQLYPYRVLVQIVPTPLPGRDRVVLVGDKASLAGADVDRMVEAGTIARGSFNRLRLEVEYHPSGPHLARVAIDDGPATILDVTRDFVDDAPPVGYECSVGAQTATTGGDASDWDVLHDDVATFRY